MIFTTLSENMWNFVILVFACVDVVDDTADDIGTEFREIRGSGFRLLPDVSRGPGREHHWGFLTWNPPSQRALK